MFNDYLQKDDCETVKVCFTASSDAEKEEIIKMMKNKMAKMKSKENYLMKIVGDKFSAESAQLKTKILKLEKEIAEHQKEKEHASTNITNPVTPSLTKTPYIVKVDNATAASSPISSSVLFASSVPLSGLKQNKNDTSLPGMGVGGK